MNLNNLLLSDLFDLQRNIEEQFRLRGIVKSKNNIIADYSEFLACRALQLERSPGSNKGFDALDKNGKKYEVKGRRPTKSKISVHLGAVRELEKRHFDFLVCVIFDENYSVNSAYLIPHGIVEKYAQFSNHTNSDKLVFNEKIGAENGVVDISNEIKRAELEVNTIFTMELRPEVSKY